MHFPSGTNGYPFLKTITPRLSIKRPGNITKHEAACIGCNIEIEYFFHLNTKVIYERELKAIYAKTFEMGMSEGSRSFDALRRICCVKLSDMMRHVMRAGSTSLF